MGPECEQCSWELRRAIRGPFMLVMSARTIRATVETRMKTSGRGKEIIEGGEGERKKMVEDSYIN